MTSKNYSSCELHYNHLVWTSILGRLEDDNADLLHHRIINQNTKIYNFVSDLFQSK